jgi:hypothetical protein
MIWGDIVLQNPELFDMLDKRIVQGTWNYSAWDSFDHILKPFHDSGFDFMFSCGVLNSNRIVPDYKSTCINIRNFNRDARKYNTLGMLNTVWDDGGHALFSLDWYGVAYGAEHSWHSNADSVADFNRRFDRAVYGAKNGQIAQSLYNLSRLSALQATYEMNEHVLWDNLVPDRMRSLKLNLAELDEIEEIVAQSEQMLQNISGKTYQADIDFIKFIIAQYRFIARGRLHAVSAAENYNQACIFQLKDKDSTYSYLEKAARDIQSIRSDIVTLRDWYTRLWAVENQSYWLDYILDRYNERILRYERIASHLQQAREFYDQDLSLPAPNLISLAVAPSKGSYFQFWLLCGPFPNVAWKGRTTDYLTSLGGESKARPIPGTMVTTEDGRQLRFSKFVSRIQNKIELDQIFSPNTEVVAYAYCRIDSPDERRVRATLGSNDGIQIYLNGEKVYQKFAKRSLIPDEDEVFLQLNKGKNHVLLKIDQNKGGWGFSFRLPDENIRNHKQKYRLVE